MNRRSLMILSICFCLSSLAAPIVARHAEAAQPQQGAAVQTVAANKVYYDPTIKNIIRRDCGRCHSGPTRNLMDYDLLKPFIANGMLELMVSPGGPMNRFAGRDAEILIAWIQDGAPETPATVVNGNMTTPPAQEQPMQQTPNPAATVSPTTDPLTQAAANTMMGRKAFPVTIPTDQVTYENTVKYIVARDCLECHSGPFRNLTNYKNLKYYADNGLLKSLVMPGGQMNRFAGNDSSTIVTWVENGAPQ